MTISLTLDKARRFAREELAERGEDYAYPDNLGCVYVWDKTATDPETGLIGFASPATPLEAMTPGCIVGAVLARAGVPLESIVDLDINVATGAGNALRALETAGLIEATPAAVEWLTEAQGVQDGKNPWRQAIVAADSLLDMEG